METRTYYVIERRGAWDVIEIGHPAPQFTNTRSWAVWRATFREEVSADAYAVRLAESWAGNSSVKAEVAEVG